MMPVLLEYRHCTSYFKTSWALLHRVCMWNILKIVWGLKKLVKKFSTKIFYCSIFRLYENPIQKPPYKSRIINAIWVNCYHRFENIRKKSNNFQVVTFTLYAIFWSKVTRLSSNSNVRFFWTHLDDLGAWFLPRSAAHGRVNMYP